MKYLYIIALALFLTSCNKDTDIIDITNYVDNTKIEESISYSVRTYYPDELTVQITNLCKIYHVSAHIELTDTERKTYALIVVKGTIVNVQGFDESFKHFLNGY